MGSEIESDSKLKTHTVKRENIMIQRENKSLNHVTRTGRTNLTNEFLI